MQIVDSYPNYQRVGAIAKLPATCICATEHCSAYLLDWQAARNAELPTLKVAILQHVVEPLERHPMPGTQSALEITINYLHFDMIAAHEKPVGRRASGRQRRLQTFMHDPLMDWLRYRFELSPFRLGLYFAVLAFASTSLTCAIEGRLLSAERGVLPMWRNFSTLLDFILLNPLAIYYIARSYNAIDAASEIKIKPPSIFVSITIVVTSLTAMAVYFYRFLEGNFLDACFIGGNIGGVTITGWIVFFWTSLYLYTLMQCVYSQARYISSILQLDPNRIDYRPFQVDNSGGMRRFAQPAMEFLRIMAVLLLTIGIFFYYDFLVYGIKESVRWLSVLVYLIAAPPIFLTPVIYLHLLMVKTRNRILEPLDNQLKDLLKALSQAQIGTVEGLADELTALTKVRTEVRSFPTWPLPLRQIVESTSYFLAPALTYLPKILSLLKGE